MVVLGRNCHELERRILRVLLLPEAPEDVAIRSCKRRNGSTTLGELGQRTHERRAEVRHDDVDLGVLRDRRRQNLLSQCWIPVGDLERLLADELVLPRLVEDLMKALVLLDALAIALG